MKINQEILEILSECTIDGAIVKINSGNLERKTYLKVNEVLETIGGKWNRKFKGHLFQGDPTEKLDQVILTGEIDPPKNFGFFPTPKHIVEEMIQLAEIKEGMTILEPSAGVGNIADLLPKENLFVVELLEANRKVLQEKGYEINGTDFLQFDGEKFDRILMNPPFEKQADVDHVVHAYSLLKEGGKLVAIMSAGATFRNNKKTLEFRKLVEEHGTYDFLPENSFKESGTLVNTIMVVLNK